MVSEISSLVSDYSSSSMSPSSGAVASVTVFWDIENCPMPGYENNFKKIVGINFDIFHRNQPASVVVAAIRRFALEKVLLLA